eukprot:TRINITY_DN3157_c0_g1_i1.p1 TRINITY_DN3157_c0_g1~~TRINITY_DN3157_c0_g1_i1.p1  ORF type:complete len:224 (+),score=112.36 TRINITY_DN3157_c0_g1_i1:52-672(+)
MSSNILEGELHKQGEKGLIKSYKKRNFCLRDDGFLRYYDGTTEKGAIDMTLVNEVRTEDEDGVDFELVTEGRVFHLRANTNEDMKYWLRGVDDYLHPKSATDKLLTKAKKGAKSAAKKTKEAAAKAKTEVEAGAVKASRTVQYGEALSDEEVAARERQKAKEKAKKEKEKAKREKEKEKIKAQEQKERERHEAEKEKLKAKKAKLK